MDTFATRLIIALGLAVLGYAAFVTYNRWAIRHAQTRHLGLEGAQPGVPTILYFTTPNCVPCRTVQAPALDKVRAHYHEAVQVIKIDAQEHPEVADHWGVMTVPTTFVIDTNGKARYFNPGVAPAEKLEQQLEQVGVSASF